MLNSYLLIAVLAWTFVQPANAAVRLPNIFGHHMVLQRHQLLPIWGSTDPGEQVTVEFLEHSISTTASAHGTWKLELPQAPAGGPHILTVTASNVITLHDVLIGEVWLCSGQSNMEMGLGASLNPTAEIAGAAQAHIRLFRMPKKFSAMPQTDIATHWQRCTPQSMVQFERDGGFSAAAYYFGRHVQHQLNIPIGLIQAAWSGTRIEPWTPPASFAAVPALHAIYQKILLRNPSSTAYKNAWEPYYKR